jgi:hypothetical protein
MGFSEISAPWRMLRPSMFRFATRKETQMRTSIWKSLIITGLAACTMAALAAPASGQVLHREGSKAVAFVGDVSAQSSAPSSGPVLHRDGSKAVPFVASVDAGPVSTAADRFHWGDAAVGAGTALGLVVLASAAWMAAHRRRRAGALGGSSA